MDLTNARTTAEVATRLGITTKEVDRILKKYPVPEIATFGKQRAWGEADEEAFKRWNDYDKAGLCPHCQKAIEVRKTARKKKAAPEPTEPAAE